MTPGRLQSAGTPLYLGQGSQHPIMLCRWLLIDQWFIVTRACGPWPSQCMRSTGMWRPQYLGPSSVGARCTLAYSMENSYMKHHLRWAILQMPTPAFAATVASIDSMPEVGLDLSLDSTLGSILIGTFLSTILFGLNLNQLNKYTRQYSNDEIFIKALVLGAIGLATVQVALSLHTCYFYLVMNFAAPVSLTHIEATWSVNLIPAVGSLITVTSHAFFARRVAMIGFRYKVVSILAVLSIGMKIGFGIALTVKGFMASSIEPYLKMTWLVGACFGAAVLADVLLTGALITVLRRGRMNHDRPEAILDTLMVYVVNTGFLNCVLDGITFLLAITRSDSLYWAAVHLVTARVYTNTFLAVLNSRRLHLKYEPNVFESGTIGLNVIARAKRHAETERWNVPQLPSKEPSVINIKITTETEGDASVHPRLRVSELDFGRIKETDPPSM